MATTGSKMNTVFAYTVVYVKDVAKSTAFYSKAFGYNIRRIDDSNRYFYLYLYLKLLIE